jgi:hypothetical protein
MKISLVLGKRQPLSRQTAWGCFTMNMAIPGTGSLLAGRISGYSQLVIGVLGLTGTVIFGMRFIVWYLRNWSRIYGSQSDPYAVWGDLWHMLRWALVGIGVFLIAWLWALSSSLRILAESRESA